jgi:hypothetical protein
VLELLALGVVVPLGLDDALVVLDGLALAPVVDGVVLLGLVPKVDEPLLKLLELGVLPKLP